MTNSYSHCSCGAKFKVQDVRYYTFGKKTETVYRSKVCTSCDTKVSTVEIPLEIATKALGNLTSERGRRPYKPRVPSCKTA